MIDIIFMKKDFSENIIIYNYKNDKYKKLKLKINKQKLKLKLIKQNIDNILFNNNKIIEQNKILELESKILDMNNLYNNNQNFQNKIKELETKLINQNYNEYFENKITDLNNLYNNKISELETKLIEQTNIINNYPNILENLSELENNNNLTKQLIIKHLDDLPIIIYYNHSKTIYPIYSNSILLYYCIPGYGHGLYKYDTMNDLIDNDNNDTCQTFRSACQKVLGEYPEHGFNNIFQIPQGKCIKILIQHVAIKTKSKRCTLLLKNNNKVLLSPIKTTYGILQNIGYDKDGVLNKFNKVINIWFGNEDNISDYSEEFINCTEILE